MSFNCFRKNNSSAQSSFNFIFLNILAFILFIGVLSLTIIKRPLMQSAFTYCSYYIIFALTITWALVHIHLLKNAATTPLLFIQRHWKGILISFLLSSTVFTSVSKDFRVLSDETNLLSVAKSMTFNKNVNNVTEGYWYYEMFWPTAFSSTEKRPFLFPFFTSITHNLLGYKVQNVFILNFFVLWTVLFLIYLLIRRYLSELWAFASMILVIAQPIVSLSATSASFELFNLLFILASVLSLRHFLDHPEHKTFLPLLMNLIMLANVRYESIIFFITFMFLLLATGYIRLKFFKQSLAYALIPFFFLSWIWQRIILMGTSDVNLKGGSWIKAFSWDYAYQNIGLFFKYILNVDGHLGYAGLVNLIGLLALAYFIIVLFIREMSSSQNNRNVFLAALFFSLFTLFGVVSCYQGGINDHPMNGRMYIPILTILSILSVCVWADLFKNSNRIAIPALAISLAFFIYYHPIATEDRLSNNLMIIREFKFVDEFLKKNADKNSLIVCGRPGQVIVYNYGAISYNTANHDIERVLQQYKNRLYSTIYVIQSVSYSTKNTFPDNTLNPRYQLETVAENQITGNYFFRISKVKIPD